VREHLKLFASVRLRQSARIDACIVLLERALGLADVSTTIAANLSGTRVRACRFVDTCVCVRRRQQAASVRGADAHQRVSGRVPRRAVVCASARLCRRLIDLTLAGVDPIGRRLLWSVVQKFQRYCTFVLTTHMVSACVLRRLTAHVVAARGGQSGVRASCYARCCRGAVCDD
jgi:hypothetical protein